MKFLKFRAMYFIAIHIFLFSFSADTEIIGDPEVREHENQKEIVQIEQEANEETHTEEETQSAGTSEKKQTP